MIDQNEARPSSTVIVARKGAGEPEVFMVQRHAESAFGSAYAFPGGVVEPDDSRVDKYCGGLSATVANARLGIESGGLSYYSAAIRELFEETGLLLADTGSLDQDLASIRDGLNDASEAWAGFVSENELSLHCDALHYVSHWITPEQQPKRYSARFFLAELPKGRVAEHCGGELTESRWVTATDMLAAERAGDVQMIFPTIKTLESLARHKTLGDLLAWAESCIEWGITSMQPVLVEKDGVLDVVLPGDMNYPGTKS